MIIFLNGGSISLLIGPKQKITECLQSLTANGFSILTSKLNHFQTILSQKLRSPTKQLNKYGLPSPNSFLQRLQTIKQVRSTNSWRGSNFFLFCCSFCMFFSFCVFAFFIFLLFFSFCVLIAGAGECYFWYF